VEVKLNAFLNSDRLELCVNGELHNHPLNPAVGPGADLNVPVGNRNSVACHST
jgi:hypothetical protein